MQIEGYKLSVIYEKLRDKYFAEYFSGEKASLKKSPTIWEKKHKIVDDKGKEIETQLVSHLFYFSDCKYLYRKYGPSQKSPLSELPIVPLTLYHVLIYLGFEIKNATKKSLNMMEKAKNLLDQFVEYHSIKQPEIKQPEQTENTDSLKSKHKKIDNSRNVILAIDPHEVPFEGHLKQLIEIFFELLNERDFLSAWHLLSPEFQSTGIWKSKFSLFKQSFVTTINFRAVQTYCFEEVFSSGFKGYYTTNNKIISLDSPFKNSKVPDINHMRCNIYFEELMGIFRVNTEIDYKIIWKEPKEVCDLIIPPTNKAINDLSKIEKFKSLNFSDYYDLKKIMNPSINKYFWFLSEINETDLRKINPEVAVFKFRKNGKCEFKFIEGRWLIDKFPDIQPNFDF